MTQGGRVFFLDNEILVDGIPMPFVAGSLVANLNGTAVELRRKQSSFLFRTIPWDTVADIDGNTFTTPDAVMAYLATQLTMARSLDIPSASAIAGSDIPRGMPVVVSRSTGQIQIARADTYTLALVVGLAAEDAAAGFVCNASRNALTLPEWSEAAGSSALAVGQPYFLAPTGGLTLAPPARPSSACSVRLGQATGPQTFAFQQSDPILL